MAFKGTLPSELWDRYDCEGGVHKLNLDMGVAAQISKQHGEAIKDAKRKDGKGAAARLQQKREKRKQLNDTDILSTIREAGMPIERVGFDDDSDSE
jgi:hypothetical protein